MAKDFKKFMNSNPREIEVPTEPTLKKSSEPKRSVGRPKVKTEETKTINIAIPLSVLEKMDIAKAKYGDNLTKYVNTVIEKDLEANFESYKTIYDMLNS